MNEHTRGSAPSAFEYATVRLQIDEIQPLRSVSAEVKRSSKFKQIAASIQEVGIVEPLVVARDTATPGRYLLLDGHLRLAALRDASQDSVTCIVSTDDEGYTYNRRVNRLATVQEHLMMLRALDRGVSEERLAKALNVNVLEIKRRRRLLNGICGEAAQILKDKHVAMSTFVELRKLLPLRQIEAAELMVEMNNYTTPYAKALVTATPLDQLKNGVRKARSGHSGDQTTAMEQESSNLDRDFKAAEKTYSICHLDLVLAKGYVSKLLDNPHISGYLTRNHAEILSEIQRILALDETSSI
jgi:hypothetical protein